MPHYHDNAGDGVIRRAAKDQPRRSWRTWLLGRPLSTADAPHQTIGKTVGLAVFASDALSSTAYATQEILVILAAAGAVAMGFSWPIALAIVALLVIVTISYEQTIHAYPSGGGAYIVARDNLGELPALTAGAALLTDYILTVAVSISSGVAQLVSAFPAMAPWRVHVAVVLVGLIMLLNLRGVKESGTAFAVPTYFFVILMTGTVLWGLVQLLRGGLGQVVDPPAIFHHGEATSVGLFLLLHAFASGTTALTGVEAISNGITAFKEPRSRNAGITLIWMSAILGTLFLGITYLSRAIGAVPSEGETVISQLARTIYDGRGLLYLLTIASTTVILIMAPTPAPAHSPRRAPRRPAAGCLPRTLTTRGSRLVYSRGIVLLSLVAALLIIAFKASVSLLIPLYAIGVFLSFTLSQGGMARRWWRSGQLGAHHQPVDDGQHDHQRQVQPLAYDRRWRLKMAINGLGSALTFVVMLVFAVTKFRDGAWIILVLLPILIVVFMGIHRHYRNLAKALSLEDYGAPPPMRRHRVVLLVSGVHRGTLEALRYAQALSNDVTALHVSADADDTARLQRKWDAWGDDVRLVILESPYRLLIEPVLKYVAELRAGARPNDQLTIVVPRFVPRRSWENVLHTQTALMLRMALMFQEGIVITDVPYQVKSSADAEPALKEGKS